MSQSRQAITLILVAQRPLYSAFPTQKSRVVDLLLMKHAKRASKHLSRGINVVLRR